MTGTSEKMMPLARQLVPKGWNVLCPEAIIPHPTRGGFAWWLRSDDPTLPLNEKSLQQVHESVLRVITEIPEGPVIVGGFSQGAAIASAMLEYDIQSEGWKRWSGESRKHFIQRCKDKGWEVKIKLCLIDY